MTSIAYTVTRTQISDTDNAIAVRGLRKSFREHVVLDAIDLAVPRGSVFALLGPNGAGKTTLVRILSTLSDLDCGSAFVAGHDVVGEPMAVRRAISMTGQHAAVDDLLTGRENLRMMGRLAGLDRRRTNGRADELVAQFDLVEVAGRRAGSYSGGTRRRLDLAVGLVDVAPVLFLDEPTTGVDTRGRQALWQVVREVAAAGSTVFLTTQYLEEADQLADRVAVLDDGRIVAEGTPADLKSRVGGELLELRFADDASLATAAAALPTARLGPGVLQVPTGGRIDEVRRILDHVSARQIDVAHIATRAPTLDDVFLSLTTPRKVTSS